MFTKFPLVFDVVVDELQWIDAQVYSFKYLSFHKLKQLKDDLSVDLYLAPILFATYPSGKSSLRFNLVTVNIE